MIYLKGHLSRPLDAVLSAPSRLAVLRALFRAKSPLSGRALALLAGINHPGAAVALAAFFVVMAAVKTFNAWRRGVLLAPSPVPGARQA